MNRKTLSKNIAVVLSFVFTSYQSPVFAGPKAAPKSSASSNLTATTAAAAAPAPAPAPAPAAAPVVVSTGGETKEQTNRLERESYRTQIKEAERTCQEAMEKTDKKKSEFLVACKSETKAKIMGTDKNKKKKGIEECSEELNECSSYGEDEMDFQQVLGSSLGSLPGMESMKMFTDMSGSVKKCSKYSPDKWETSVEKAERNLDSRKEKLNQATKDAKTAAEKLKEKYEEAQEKFNTAQTKKDEADAKRQEDALNKKNAFNEKIEQFEAAILKNGRETLELQQQQVLMVAARGHAVNQYELDLIGCETKANEVRDDQRKKGGLADSGSSAQRSNAKRIFMICRNQVLAKRSAEATNYKSQLTLLNDSIARKAKELQTLQNKIAEFKQMYAQSESQTAQAQQKEDASFLQSQQNSFLRISAMANQMQSDNIESQKLIQEAQYAVNTASNKLGKLESEEPVGTKDKGLADMQSSLQEYTAGVQAYNTICASQEERAKAARKGLENLGEKTEDKFQWGDGSGGTK